MINDAFTTFKYKYVNFNSIYDDHHLYGWGRFGFELFFIPIVLVLYDTFNCCEGLPSNVHLTFDLLLFISWIELWQLDLASLKQSELLGFSSWTISTSTISA